MEPGPDPSELEQILAAGIRVPDHGKLAPWRIQVVDKAGQEMLGELCALAAKERDPSLSAAEVELERRRPARSPVLLIVTDRLVHDHRIPVYEQVLSGGAVCQNLLNASHALGYVGQWLTQWPTSDAKIRAALGHGEGVTTIGWIHIGSAESAPEERRRASLADVVSAWPLPASDAKP